MSRTQAGQWQTSPCQIDCQGSFKRTCARISRRCPHLSVHHRPGGFADPPCSETSGKVLERAVWPVFFLGNNFSVLVAGYVHTLPMPVFFTCRFYVGARRAQKQSGVNFRIVRLACPLPLAPTFLLTNVPRLTLLTDAPIIVVIENLTYFWNFKQAKISPLPHPVTQKTTSQKGQTCTMTHVLSPTLPA